MPMDVYMLPFTKGTEVAITQGNNSPYSHYGKATYALDFSLGTQDEGTLLVAAASGIVAMIKEDTLDNECGGEAYAAKGNHIVIRHDDGCCDLYLHLQHASVSGFGLSMGAQVSRGQPIGRLGKTGYTNCRAHLHFQRQYCGSTYWQQSVPIVFADVPGDGVPKEGQHYVSGNEPAQPASLKDALQSETAVQVSTLLQPAQAFLAAALQGSLGVPLSPISRLTAADGRQYFVQVFELDTLYVHIAPPGGLTDWNDIRGMAGLLIQNYSDEWGLALWRFTYSNAGAEYRPSWSSHQYVLNQLATRPLGAPLGGGTTNGVHVLNVGGKRYEAEVYARDTIYWAPPNWGDIQRLSEL
jgi:murein DD-endopeptidase MepM/ murein hydrolase activator NlpD